jgi:membrane protein YqaA with SNARE-associated domain
MAVAKPKRAIYYGLAASIFSVLGGIAGYYLGFWFWEATQNYFLTYIFSPSILNGVLSQLNENAFLAIFLAGFTPIPFKVFTIAAGIAHMDLFTFVSASLLSRTLRFTIEGGLIYIWGPKIRIFIDKYFEKITLYTGFLIVLIFVLYKLWG